MHAIHRRGGSAGEGGESNQLCLNNLQDVDEGLSRSEVLEEGFGQPHLIGDSPDEAPCFPPTVITKCSRLMRNMPCLVAGFALQEEGVGVERRFDFLHRRGCWVGCSGVLVERLQCPGVGVECVWVLAQVLPHWLTMMDTPWRTWTFSGRWASFRLPGVRRGRRRTQRRTMPTHCSPAKVRPPQKTCQMESYSVTPPSEASNVAQWQGSLTGHWR